MPLFAAHVWAIYIDLCQTRQSGGFGPSRLSRHDIHAWERDERRLERWERQAIMQLDAEHLRIMTAKEEAPEQEAHKVPAVEAHRR